MGANKGYARRRIERLRAEADDRNKQYRKNPLAYILRGEALGFNKDRERAKRGLPGRYAAPQ